MTAAFAPVSPCRACARVNNNATRKRGRNCSAARLRFEPHDIAAQLDARERYAVQLTEEFPFSIKLFHYTSRRHTRGATWHERLELFLPCDGPAKLIGEFSNPGEREFTPPNPGELIDWVLVLDDAAKNFLPPGQPKLKSAAG